MKLFYKHKFETDKKHSNRHTHRNYNTINNMVPPQVYDKGGRKVFVVCGAVGVAVVCG